MLALGFAQPLPAAPDSVLWCVAVSGESVSEVKKRKTDEERPGRHGLPDVLHAFICHYWKTCAFLFLRKLRRESSSVPVCR